MAELDSYTEASPSGTGVHVLVFGELPPGGGNKKGQVEMYGSGRYFTCTGQHLPGTPLTVNDRTEALASVHARLIGTDDPQADTPSKPTEPLALDDEKLLATARNNADFGCGRCEDDSAAIWLFAVTWASGVAATWPAWTPCSDSGATAK